MVTLGAYFWRKYLNGREIRSVSVFDTPVTPWHPGSVRCQRGVSQSDTLEVYINKRINKHIPTKCQEPRNTQRGAPGPGAGPKADAGMKHISVASFPVLIGRERIAEPPTSGVSGSGEPGRCEW